MNLREIKSGSWTMFFGLLLFGFGICAVVLRLLHSGFEIGKYIPLIMVIVGAALIAEGVQTMIIGAHASAQHAEPAGGGAKDNRVALPIFPFDQR